MNLPTCFSPHQCSLNLVVSAGANVHWCIEQGVVLALSEHIVVRFDHNGRTYVIEPKAIINAIADQHPGK